MQAKEPISTGFTKETPYPVIEPTTAEDVPILQDNLAGNNSKMSMYSLYLFNSVAAQTEEMQVLFEKLAEAELFHMQRLAAYINLCGEEPRLWKQECGVHQYWTPAYVHYTVEPFIMIQNAIASEQAAIEKYTRQLNKPADPSVKTELLRLQQDDELHVQILKDFLKTM